MSGHATAGLGVRLARASLVACLACAPAPARAGAANTAAAHTWTAVETAHLRVLTDGGRAVGERVAVRLEDLRQALQALAPALVVDAAPVQVIVFRDAALARAYAPTWRGLHDDVAGFFHAGPDRRRLLFVDDEGRTPSVAQHEYLHALLDAALPEAPLWLNEGLAEYFSTFTADDGRARAGAPVRAHVDWLEAHDLMPLAELFAVSQTSPAYHEGDRRGTFYAESWALVHLLLSGGEGDLARLQRALLAARDGERFDDAFAREFGGAAVLRERLIAALTRPRLPEREWTLSGAAGPTPRVRDRAPAADVLASLGLEFLSRPVVPREDAEEHLRASLALDPRQADALAGLGWLELIRGHRDEARKWFDRALEPAPCSATAARVLATEMLSDASERHTDEDREAVGRYVRAALQRALLASPGEPELTALLARSWVLWPGDYAQPGYDAAVLAARALPGRPDVQLDRLALAALTGRDDEAGALYERWFRRAGTPELQHAARTALLAGDVRSANQSAARGDFASAEARLAAARDRVQDDPELARQAADYLERLRASSRAVRETAQENRAIAEYNTGVTAANKQRYAEAAAAFRRAAAASARDTFQRQSLRLAKRMDQRAQGARAMALARQGRRAQAIAILEAMDRSVLEADDLRWLDTSLARLKSDGR